MPGTPKPGAVVFAKGIERVAGFYAQLLSLPVSHAGHDHIILESENLRLVIHAIPGEVACSITITEPPAVRSDTPIKLVLPVESIEDARQIAPALGGHVDPEEREWEFGGCRVCDGHDPEGNVFQLLQSAH